MEIPSLDNTDALASRRQLLKLAAAAGAGLALAATTVRAAPATAPVVVPAKGPTPPVNYKFNLSTYKPEVANAGGSVTFCREDTFPVVGGNAAAVYLLKLKPGALREPHWHPNCWEFDVMVTGKVQMTIVAPDGVPSVFTLDPGEVAFVPQGYVHSIKNIGTVDVVMPIVFNNSMPSDIGLSTMLGGMDESQFAQTFGVPTSALDAIPKPPPGTSYIVP
jgi:oxalate decarboxylase